jgi:hypothetical protein
VHEGEAEVLGQVFDSIRAIRKLMLNPYRGAPCVYVSRKISKTKIGEPSMSSVKRSKRNRIL